MELVGLLLSSVYLLLATAAGAGLLSLVPIRFSIAERLAYGFFVGVIPAGLAALLAAIGFGFGPLDFWLTLVPICVLAAWLVLARKHHRSLKEDFSEALRAPMHKHLWLALTVVPWTVYFAVLFGHALVTEKEGLYAGHLFIWGDWALHLSYASSFLYGHNFPPEFPVLAHHHYEYHFMPDFLAAGFAANGMSLTGALGFGSWAAVTAMIAVFHCAATRLSGSRAVGFLAPTIFLLSGGLGFVYLFGDLAKAVGSPGGIGQFLTHLPRAYTQIPDQNLDWLSPVLAYLVPQRSMAFGLAVVLIAMVLIKEALATASWRVMTFAGALLGLAPLYHLHSTVGMSVIAVFIALMGIPVVLTRPALRSFLVPWIAFAVPLLVLALPTILWMYPQASTGPDIRPRFGWLASEASARLYPDGFVWFWLKNLGAFLPLAIFGQLLGARLGAGLSWFVAPFWSMFVIPNFLILQPWDWDNTKWFLLWFLAGSVLVAATVVWLAKKRPRRLPRITGAVAAAVLVVVLCLSGLADVWRGLDYHQNRFLFARAEEISMAGWVREHTPATALFLTGEQHNHPISTLAGRRILVGYPGWLWVFTLPYQSADQDARDIYAGLPNAIPLLHRDGIAYVVVGPQERSEDGIGMHANEAYFRASFPLVYSSHNYSIYRVG